jgi:hypothetical protein
MFAASHSFGVNFDDEEDDADVGTQGAHSSAVDDEEDELLKLCMMAEQDSAPLPTPSRSAPAQRAQVALPSRQPSRPTAMVMEEAFPSKAKATDQNTLRELQQLFAEAQRAPEASSLSGALNARAFRPTTNFADIPVSSGPVPTGKESLKRTYGVVINTSTENVVPPPMPSSSGSSGSYRDKWSGFRLSTVLTSPLLLDKFMEHRRPLRVASLEREIKDDGVPYDFVLFGIVINGGLTKLTAKNEKYITWRVSDLKGSSVTVCLFKKAYEKHKIVGEGTVVAILNPSVWKADKKCPAVSCSFDTQVLSVGICPDLGLCKGITRTGELCGVSINLEQGSVCEFHLQQQLHAVRSKSAVLNNRSVAGASSNRLFVPGAGAVFEPPVGYKKVGPRVPMEVAYTPKMNASTPGRVALSANSSVSLENYEYFASFAPPPPATTTWKPTIASSPTVRKIHETATAKAAELAAKSLQKSSNSTGKAAPKPTETATKTVQKAVESTSKMVPKATESSAKTAPRPASRPIPAMLSSPVAQPVFTSSEFDDDEGLIVLDDPADDAPSSAGGKRPHDSTEMPSKASKKPATVASGMVSPARAMVPKQPSVGQCPAVSQSLSRSSPVAVNDKRVLVAASNASKTSAHQPRSESSKVLLSQPSSSPAAGLAPSAVAALQAKIQAASKTQIYSSGQAACALPGGGPVPAPPKDNSQLMNTARMFGVDIEAVKTQHSAHEDIADQSIKEREQKRTDMLFQAAKLEERQMGVLETKVSVWRCTQCSYLGYKYCPAHEDKMYNQRKEVVQRYFSCAGCRHRITWLRGPLCNATCSKCSGSQWKQCSQFKGRVGSSEDEWRKANTPSEFSLYHQR